MADVTKEQAAIDPQLENGQLSDLNIDDKDEYELANLAQNEDLDLPNF